MLNANKKAESRKINLFLVLTGIFISNAILAELIGVKIFSVSDTFSLDFISDYNLTAGVIIWPVVFITTDIINEYFGKSGVKKATFLAVGLITYIFLAIYLVTLLKPAQFWLDINNADAEGNAFDINYAFNRVYTQGMNIIIGSLVAFVVSQLLDAWVFHRLRKITGSKKIWLRATGSTLVSQLIDSFVVLFIAFNVFGDWSFAQVLAVGVANYIYKFIVAVALTPVLYAAHYVIDHYLGIRTAEKLMHEAEKDKSVVA